MDAETSEGTGDSGDHGGTGGAGACEGTTEVQGWPFPINKKNYWADLLLCPLVALWQGLEWTLEQTQVLEQCLEQTRGLEWAQGLEGAQRLEEKTLEQTQGLEQTLERIQVPELGSVVAAIFE